MRENVFDEVVSSTIDLLRRNIKKANGKITHTSLIGGFGRSPYLRKRILNEFPIDSPLCIGDLIEDNRGDSVAMRGALFYGSNCSILKPQTGIVEDPYQSPETAEYNKLVCLGIYIKYNLNMSTYASIDIGYDDFSSWSCRDSKNKNDDITEIIHW